MARYRQDARNPHAVFLQTGPGPSDGDPLVGLCVNATLARALVGSANDGLDRERVLPVAARRRLAEKLAREAALLEAWFGGLETDLPASLREIADAIWPEGK